MGFPLFQACDVVRMTEPFEVLLSLKGSRMRRISTKGISLYMQNHQSAEAHRFDASLGHGVREDSSRSRRAMSVE